MIGQMRFGLSWPIAMWKLPENKQQKVISYITVACVLFCGEDPRIQTKQNDWDVTKYTSQNNNIIEIWWWHLNDSEKRQKKNRFTQRGRLKLFSNWMVSDVLDRQWLNNELRIYFVSFSTNWISTLILPSISCEIFHQQAFHATGFQYFQFLLLCIYEYILPALSIADVKMQKT